jgi:hypothetical protein
MLIRFWRELLILVLSAVTYVLYTRPDQVCPTAITVAGAHTDEKVEEIATEQKVTTITVKPDGTKEKKIVETKKDTKVSQVVADKKDVSVVTSPISRYDLHVATPVSAWKDWKDYQVGIGVRLGDLPAFGTLDYRFRDRAIIVGLRMEF